MSVSKLLSEACQQAGGTYYNGACRCSDGRLKNMKTGECVSERDAGPAISPVQQPGRVWDSASGRYIDANTPVGSTPRVITTVSGVGDRRAVTDKRAEVTNMLTPTRTATGSLQRSLSGFLDMFKNGSSPFVVTDHDGGEGVPVDAPVVELGLRYDPNEGQKKPPKIRDGSAGNQKMGAAESVNGANGNGAPMESGIPAGLILAGLSFLLFRS